ncbi:MAG: hypothetical protein L0Z50_19220 [Verrucomicrobiales bacterium]|nr:hypothetical protein [Verrucomicrobiales bacterium]
MKKPKIQVAWKLCEADWWDAMRGETYSGWSVARQCRVRWINRRLRQSRCGWYVFNDRIHNKMIGPFKTPTAAMEACPLITG